MQNMEELFSPPRNFGALPSSYTGLETAKVVILPAPYDSTTEWHSGTREGPQAIIGASQYLELYNIELDQEIYKLGIHTLPEIQPLLSGPEEMVQRAYHVAKQLIQQAKFVVMLGGEHSLSLEMVQALKEEYQDFCVLQLEAHADLRNEHSGTKYSHACVMRRVLELCPIIQVGMRSLSREEQQFLNQNKMRPFYISTPTPDLAWPQQIVASLHDNFYVSIDLDVFDHSIMPAVDTAEPGGMQWHEALNLVRLVTLRKHVIGFDLVELCPREGPTSCAFLAAKLAYKLIGYAMS